MVTIDYCPSFEKKVKKIKSLYVKSKVKKQIEKIICNPEIGKPMMYGRKGTREVYVSSYRLSYAWIENENKIIFLDLYHKDEQ